MSHIPAMSFEQISDTLKVYREMGAENIWLGGGEPTLHPDLIATIELAKSLGYQTIKIQTNGIRFHYPEFAEACIKAGANLFSFTIMGADSKTHDQITQNPKSFSYLLQGVRNLADRDADLEADVLITTDTVRQLSQIVEIFSGRGVSRFSFWLLSLYGASTDKLNKCLPTMTSLRPHLEAAFNTADKLGRKAISWHTPYCVLNRDYRERYLPSSSLDLLVITPGPDSSLESFMVQDSPIEGGAFLESCQTCSRRADCLGPREDYLKIHGADEFHPIKVEN
jgi:molybdenum cofactor biosynthesis enzyme MoaA